MHDAVLSPRDSLVIEVNSLGDISVGIISTSASAILANVIGMTNELLTHIL